MQPLIRRATPADIPQMYDVSAKAHLSEVYASIIPADYRDGYQKRYDYSPKAGQSYERRIASRLDDDAYDLYVAEQEGRVIGYIIGSREADIYYINDIFVDPEVQGLGVGKSLLVTVLTSHPEVSLFELTVLADNASARVFYEKQGFVFAREAQTAFYGAKEVILQRQNIDKKAKA